MVGGPHRRLGSGRTRPGRRSSVSVDATPHPQAHDPEVHMSRSHKPSASLARRRQRVRIDLCGERRGRAQPMDWRPAPPRSHPYGVQSGPLVVPIWTCPADSTSGGKLTDSSEANRRSVKSALQASLRRSPRPPRRCQVSGFVSWRSRAAGRLPDGRHRTAEQSR